MLASARAKAIEESRPEIWDAKDVALFIRTSSNWVYVHAEDGTLPGFRMGGRWRFDAATIRKWYRLQMAPGLAVGQVAR